MLGTLLLVSRFVKKDLQRRRVEAVLLIMVMAAAATAAALALMLRGVAAHPYRVTRVATTGPDVVITDLLGRLPAARFAALISEPGVVGHSGPFPVAASTLRAGAISVSVTAEGRDTATAEVDQPKLTEGSWVSPGEIVVERSFAEAVGVRTGQHVTLAGHPFGIAGVAVTAATPAYPMSSPGLIWVTRADAQLLGAPSPPIYYALNLRLSNPSTAAAFADRLTPSSPLDAGPSTMTWQFIRDQDATLVTNAQQDLLIGASMLTLLGAASVAVLVGGRMAEQTRSIGLLKALGATPTLVIAILLAQNIPLAVAAAAVGIGVGSLVAPTLADPGAGLIGTPGATAVGLTTLLAGVGLTLVVTLLASFLPAYRAAKSATIQSLNDSPHPPLRTSWLVAASAALPTSLLVGLRLASRRPRRAILAAVNIAITVATVVAVLIFQQYAQVARQGLGPSAVANPQTNRDTQVLVTMTIMFGLLAAINIGFLAWAGTVDSRRSLAIVHSLGATPSQVLSALVAAQIAPSLAGGLVGIPLGIGLYTAASSNRTIPLPPVSALATAVAGVLLVTAAFATVAAKGVATRRPGAVLREDL